MALPQRSLRGLHLDLFLLKCLHYIFASALAARIASSVEPVVKLINSFASALAARIASYSHRLLFYR